MCNDFSLGTLYNNVGGADCSCLIRNLINTCGYACFIFGAIILASELSFSSKDEKLWLGVISLVVAPSVCTQHIPDQEDARQRGRRTVPLIVGDQKARDARAVPVALWHFLVPGVWRASGLGLAVTDRLHGGEEGCIAGS